MAHIQLDTTVPGIRSLVLFRPDTGKPLYELVQLLLRGDSSLSEAERELIAAYVSHRNGCAFCRNSHAAAASCLYGDDKEWVAAVLNGSGRVSISEKLTSLLNIAGKVQVSGKEVSEQDILLAQRAGATHREIHDTVLIAATFSLFNRYVDGMDTYTPDDMNVYEEMGKRMVHGYRMPESNK